MVEKKVKWYKVADGKDTIVWQNRLALLEAGERKVTLAHINNKIFACAFKCPHAGGILAKGFIDAVGNIVCPLHNYKFSLHNGRNISGEGYCLKTFPVDESVAGIFIGFEENGFEDFLK
jgi:3-phenylpropionate/trans-cinnamate dioxygenase ferredoxin subunit